MWRSWWPAVSYPCDALFGSTTFRVARQRGRQPPPGGGPRRPLSHAIAVLGIALVRTKFSLAVSQTLYPQPADTR